MAHNLARWTARIGLGERIVTTKTLRRRFFALAGRITRSARRLTLHLPQRLALGGDPVQPRPGPTASHSTPSLTAPVRQCPNVPANSRQSGPRGSFATSSPHHLALRNVRRRSQGLPAATEDRRRPHLPEIAPGPSPPASHRPFCCCNLISSVDSG